MIKYRLRCNQAHEFDSWFRDSAAFDALAQAGALSCPECGASDVEKALMAPSIGRSPKRARRRPAAAEPVSLPAPAPATDVASPVESKIAQMAPGDKMREALFALKRAVEKNAENVGDRFADEARKIHRGEADARHIYGDASAAEAEALAEEGVPVARIPWPKHDDS